jgi:hypothetical protein
VIQVVETRQVPWVTPAAAESGQASVVTSAAEVGGDLTAVMEVALMTCQLIECKPGGTSVEHPQNYLPKVLPWPSFSSSSNKALYVPSCSIVALRRALNDRS